MAVAPGTRIGTYEITAALGAGGMGEVYRARDTKLKREVAIKVLPSEVAADAERLARFQREAEVLASLNHPHIAQIYGLENPPEGGHHIVMELVEGEDLAQRIARGPIPLDEALPIARQITEALEAAHDAGIIHRDLKPANIKVRPDGAAKVLDFGLAKALDPGSGSGDARSAALANSPTITSPAMTQRGVILGTAAYMSPEQAKGKPVDRRTDIWAFGCVLFEMLTGTRAFAGDDVSDTLVSILRDEPRWVELPSNTPPYVTQLLRRCLQKDPQKRLPHIGAARLELAESGTAESISPTAPRSNRWHTPAAIGVIAGAAAVAIVAFIGRPAPRPDTRRPAVRFTVATPTGTIFPGANGVPRFAVSPDGRHIAYQLQDSTSVKLFVRPLAAIEAEPVAGENQNDAMAGGVPGGNTQQPFWSPDGQTLGYFDSLTAQMKKRDLRTQLTDVVTSVPGIQMSGTWAGDVILYSSVLTGGIHRVRPDGKDARQITIVDAAKQETAHLWPEFLADGSHFTYLATFRDDSPPVLYVASIDGAAPRKLFDSPTGARFAWPDRLVFVRNEALLSQRFDLNSLSTVGEPDVITASVLFTPAGRIGASAASQAPVIVHAAGPGLTPGEGFETHWLDRSGSVVAGSPSSIVVGINGLRLAAGGRTLLYTRGDLRSRGEAATAVWAQDTQRGIETRLTSNSAPGARPAVSPDGSRMVYREFDRGRISLMLMSLSGTTPAERLFVGPDRAGVVPFDWSPRDEILFFLDSRDADRSGLWLLPLAGDRRPVRYLAGEYRMGASLSPDGRWIAYAAGGTPATSQVFVQSFSDLTLGKWPVSPIGGSFPRWRADGRELFYLDNRRQLIAVPIATSTRLEIGKAVTLFGDVGTDRLATVSYPYDVMPDGKRFVVMRPRASADQSATLIVDIK